MSRILYIGNKRYSSWSLRPYLALAHADLAFETRTIMLDLPQTKREILAVNPAGKVPVLVEGELVVWDSLAICEYAHELAPKAGLWPAERARRARARAIAAEMHSGFAAMRRDMSMDLCASRPGVGHTPEALADAARVMTIWREALAASEGPFLFGAFTIADAMFAPVTTRFTTYAVPMDDVCRRYCEAIQSHPAFVAWKRDADGEPPKP